MASKTKGDPETKTVEAVIEPSGLRADQYEVIVSAVRRIENDITAIDRDLEHDRQDMQDFKIRLGTLEGELRELRKSVNLNAERVKDKVADVVEPMQKQVSNAVTDLKEAVEKKKVLVLNRRSIFSKLFRK